MDSEKVFTAEARSIARLLRAEQATAIERATDESSCARLWNLRRAFSESLKATGLKKFNEDVVVPRGQLVDLVDFTKDLQTRSGFPIACFGHAGDGNIHVNIMVRDDDEPAIHARAEAVLDELFAKIIAWGGATQASMVLAWQRCAGGISPFQKKIAPCIKPSKALSTPKAC